MALNYLELFSSEFYNTQDTTCKVKLVYSVENSTTYIGVFNEGDYQETQKKSFVLYTLSAAESLHARLGETITKSKQLNGARNKL